MRPAISVVRRSPDTGGSEAGDPDIEAWDAWTPAEAAAVLAGVRAPWCVAAGWAIDLFLGTHRREHGDLEIAVPADRFPEVERALAGFDLYVPVGPTRVRPYALVASPESHQTWVRDPASGRWRLDVFREPHDGDTWISRRDERIRMPYRELIERTADGIPYARPEVVLLFKAKHSEEDKNEADLADTLPRLGRDRRRLLGEWLGLAHPGHPWTARLA
jgi:hypothetical protein